MSSKLPTLDLTSQPVGFQGTIDFSQFMKFNPSQFNQKANIWLFNESGAGLDISFRSSGNAHYLPAGGWGYFSIEPNDSMVIATITYLLPNPPVSQLNAIYYAPGEPLPQSFTLGNSPIGIGGTVNTSLNSLSNEGNPANQLVVDIGDAAFPQLYTLYTDGHGIWYVDQGGVRHQVMKVQTAGNPLQLGQNGDITEILGDLQITQAGLTTNNQFDGTTGTNNAVIQPTAGNEIVLADAADHWLFKSQGGSSFFTGIPGQAINFQIPFGTTLASLTQVLLHLVTALQVDGSFTCDNGNIGSDGLGDFTVNGNVETHKNLIPHPPTVPLVGGGGGTATLYALFTGDIKCYIIMLEAFKTGASNQSIVLPTAFTKGAAWIVTDSPGYSIVSGGANQTVSFMTTTQNSTNTATGQSWNLASLIHAWDTITWPSGNVSAHNGFFFIIGV